VNNRVFDSLTIHATGDEWQNLMDLPARIATNAPLILKHLQASKRIGFCPTLHGSAALFSH
jgi:hypothetical protein